MADRRAIHAIVHGRVQGVFFRAFVKEKALELKIAGWVKNNPDRTVELVAYGSSENINKLLTELHQGPKLAEVTHVDLRQIDDDISLCGFQITR